jgi:hypothetical protein
MNDIQRRTLREWMAYLDNTQRELTLTEFMAVMLFNDREYTRLLLEEIRQSRQAAEHTEGMLGALDVFAATVAERSGLPYASSGDVRAALDRARDDARRAALANGRERETT